VQQGKSDAFVLVAASTSAYPGGVMFASGWFDHPPRPEKISEKSVTNCLILEIRGTRITTVSGWFLFSRNKEHGHVQHSVSVGGVDGGGASGRTGSI
jgi:hypothetical protein